MKVFDFKPKIAMMMTPIVIKSWWRDYVITRQGLIVIILHLVVNNATLWSVITDEGSGPRIQNTEF